MRLPSPARRRRLAAVAFVLSWFLIPYGPATSASVAAESSAEDVGTIVSSDGRVFPAAPLSVLESPPFHGTGVLPEGMHAEVVPDHPDVIPLEIDQDGNLIDVRGSSVAGTESVIDTDERRQVTDTTKFPYRAIAALIVTFPDGDYICTGFFIDADTVATAGHCVYSTTFGVFASSITVYPGRNGDSAPYGSATAIAKYTSTRWINKADHRADYGAIKLDTPLGNTVGWFGYGVKRDDRLVNAGIRIFGYPADKTPFASMWGTRRRIKGVEDQKLYYKIDTYGGQSGSPIYGKVSNSCQICAFGIHAYGVGIEPFAASNSGTRVSDAVFANLAYWASQ